MMITMTHMTYTRSKNTIPHKKKKMSSGSRRICLAGSSSVEAMALFHYKLFWYQTLLGLFTIAKTCMFTLRLLIETF